MAHRTTLVLDDDSLAALRELAGHLQVTQSEAIRRAVVSYRDQIKGPAPTERLRRRRILEQLFEMFEGHDPEAEIRQLKEEDEAWEALGNVEMTLPSE